MIPIQITKAKDFPTSIMSIDLEGLIVSCRITNVSAAGSSHSLLRQAEAFAGVQRRYNYLTAGEAELLIDDAGFIRELDWRAGPNNLQERALELFAGSEPAQASVIIDWDADQRADLQVQSRCMFDRRSNTLRMSFSSQAPSAWYTIASNMRLSITRGGCLSAIQMEGLSDDLHALVHM